jgi:PilZ domain
MMASAIRSQVQMIRRRNTRADIAKEAAVFFGSSRTMLPCAALDLSKRGAKIALGRPYVMPRRLLLSFDNFETARSSRVVWTRGNFAGVEFIEPS